MWNQLDALTGLLNQNSYLKQTGGVRCKGGVLVVFDVDDFKQINDRYGHIQGDLCLAGIAECIKKSYANFGYCYRIGGDEFCVLLKNGGNEGRCKQEFLQRLQEKRGEIAFLPTVSYGSAPFSGEDIVKVKDRADQDMYQYKKERKNRKRLS
ncbi:GGDEF domain-containing protein [Dorea longicatena]